MDLASLVLYFTDSPVVRLIRSPNGAFITQFLHSQFKQSATIVRPMDELLLALRQFKESIRHDYPQALRDKPEHYLAEWCAADCRWLHRFLDANNEQPMYQLTPASEEVLALLDRALDQGLGFIGTESRLKLVINSLSDLVVQASADPQARIDHLRQQRQRIDDELSRIENEGVVDSYRPAQIRERFATAVAMLKQLQGDFRAVEERFKAITSEVQHRQQLGEQTRGGILGHALDAEDLLKREDQGVSFHEFVRFILSPTQQEHLRDIISQLTDISEIAHQGEGLDVIRRMVPSLLAEAQKVMRTNQRLSATLNRLLDRRAHQERLRLASVLRDIRAIAVQLAHSPPSDRVSIEVPSHIEVHSPTSRTFWRPKPVLQRITLTENDVDQSRKQSAFAQLVRLRRLDWKQLRRQVVDAARLAPGATLADLLAEHPPENGVIEVLAYLQIARDDGHSIQRDATQTIVVAPANDQGAPLELEIPLVHFLAKPSEERLEP
jgi:hypothetical protein